MNCACEDKDGKVVALCGAHSEVREAAYNYAFEEAAGVADQYRELSLHGSRTKSEDPPFEVTVHDTRWAWGDTMAEEIAKKIRAKKST